MKTSVHVALASVIAVGGIVGTVAVVKQHAVKPPAARMQVARAAPAEATPPPARAGMPPLAQPPQDVPRTAIGESKPAAQSVETAAAQPTAPESPKPMVVAKPPRSEAVAGAAAVPAPPPASPKSKPPLSAPVARVALSFVGANADAEAVWLDAINDPAVPPNERKDLIEDLNEDGFPDPKNITPNDVPLVVSRIQLIESIAADSMDETNLAAFAEAYKDLVNMLDRATRQ
jgi:hypothetical protein